MIWTDLFTYGVAPKTIPSWWYNINRGTTLAQNSKLINCNAGRIGHNSFLLPSAHSINGVIYWGMIVIGFCLSLASGVGVKWSKYGGHLLCTAFIINVGVLLSQLGGRYCFRRESFPPHITSTWHALMGEGKLGHAPLTCIVNLSEILMVAWIYNNNQKLQNYGQQETSMFRKYTSTFLFMCNLMISVKFIWNK